MKITEKKKPESIREWIAMKLVRLAQWIYPDSEAVMAFYAQLMHDEMIYGQSITRVAPDDLYINKGDETYKRNKKGDWIKQK